MKCSKECDGHSYGEQIHHHVPRGGGANLAASYQVRRATRLAHGARVALEPEHGPPDAFPRSDRARSVLFGAVYGRMAYLFMTDEDEFVDRTWEPDSGENAVIIQPGQPSSSTTQPLLTGPTLIKMVHRLDRRHLTAVACEFSVELMLGEDPEPALVHDPDVLSGNKIGGTPGWLQGPEFPAGDEAWRLLLQLDSTRVPFSVNFGDAGIAYAFIASDGTSGKLLWQSA